MSSIISSEKYKKKKTFFEKRFLPVVIGDLRVISVNIEN